MKEVVQIQVEARDLSNQQNISPKRRQASTKTTAHHIVRLFCIDNTFVL
jgi:hypothetical protein